MFASKDTLLTRPSGYNIARSVRLRSSASGYFNRTPSVAGNQQKFTMSAWVKRGTLGNGSATNVVMSAYDGSSSTQGGVLFDTNDTLTFYTGGSGSYGRITTSAVFRDPSAWYHVVAVCDTTQATSTNRMALYINGVAQTVTFNNTPAQNYNGQWNSTVIHTIGRYASGSPYFDGYLTEINFIDGQALTPSSFGETDSITGVWKPKAYSGTYGTNGFELNFSDNSNNTAATIGKDYSGNGNNWTPNNISVTSGVTYDSMVDSPTVSATSSNYAVWNQLQKTSTLSQANLLSAGGGSAIFYSVASTISIPSGKWYWEITCVSNTDGLTGIVETNQMIDVIRNGNYVGQTSLGYGYHANGKKYNNATSVAYGATYTTNDIIGVAFNADTGDLTFYKNGTSQGTAYTVSTAYTWLPADSVYASDSKAVNFGQRPFTYTPPTGFVALNTYNLPASTIKNGAAYMAATTYTGTGSTQSITNTVGSTSFQPDFVWIKSRSNAENHNIVDSIRGAGVWLASNLTQAETNDTGSYGVSTFNSNGFTVISNGTRTNASGYTYVGWQWKAGGTSASNTNGSITSTVSAGATQGFSVVTYTANGSTGTVGHGLGVAPSMIIVKKRNAVERWCVFHTSISNGYIYLNETFALETGNAQLRFGNNSTVVQPTSSVFSVGSSNDVNGTSGTYVAYCFSAVAGYSAFGSYTGNGSADGPFVYLGFRPRLIIIKETTPNARNWVMYDSSRSTYNQVGAQLLPNLSNAEDNGSGLYNQMDFLSNGVKFRASTNSEPTNESGATYIYAAFAEVGFKSALAR